MTSSLTTLEPLYTLDTHALIWYLKKDKKLGKQASGIFDAAEQGETKIIVSAIVMAELFYADEKWHLFQDFTAIYNDIIAKPYFRYVEFYHHEVLDFIRDMAVPEMHDRMIVGVAKRFNTPLLTSDPKIVAAGLVKIVW